MCVIFSLSLTFSLCSHLCVRVQESQWKRTALQNCTGLPFDRSAGAGNVETALLNHAISLRAAFLNRCMHPFIFLQMRQLIRLAHEKTLRCEPSLTQQSVFSGPKPTLHGLKFDWFGGDWLRFDPKGCLYPSWSISWLGYNQSEFFYLQLLLAGIATSSRHCVLPAGMASCAPPPPSPNYLQPLEHNSACRRDSSDFNLRRKSSDFQSCVLNFLWAFSVTGD